MNDPWAVLGVTRASSDDEIKQAYRRLAKQHHPDRPGGDETKFKQVNEAYDIIKNGGPEQQQQQAPNGFNFNSRNPFEGFEDIFAQQFGSQFRQRPRRNADTRITVPVSLEDIIHQSKKILDLKFRNGHGRQVTITLPPGVTDGAEVRYAQYGENTIPDVPAGSLFVTFQVKPHPQFTVEEHNLVKRLNISIREAMIGTEKIIDTLDGRNLKLNIRPGTQSKTRLRIPEGGLPRNKKPNGDLFVEINVQIPALTETDLEKKLQDLL